MMYEKNSEILQNFEYKDQIKSKKRIANNTLKIELENGTTIYRFHEVNIITIKNDSIILNSGGFRTPTTKERINQFNPLSSYVSQKNYIWYIGNHEFYDGMTFNKNGDLMSEKKTTNKKDWNKAKKKINEFVNLINDMKEIPIPNNGDCWFCLLREVKTNKPMGDLTNDHSHLISHIQEKYLHGSLILNALKEAGYRDIFISMIFNNDYDYGLHRKETIKRALRNYMIKRLLNDTYFEQLLNLEKRDFP